MLGLQPLHIVVIVGLALLIFGPARIPELARALGRAIVEFKQATASIEDDLHKGLEDKPAVRSEPPPESPKSPA
jgi:sec-independent protein translocase protein TatA